MGRRNMKAVWDYGRLDVISCYEKVVSGWNSCKNIFSLRLCMVCVASPDTIIASDDYLGVRIEGNPPCNAEDNICVEHLVIEDWFRGN